MGGRRRATIVKPGDDLDEALAGAEPGATLSLAAGEHRLKRPFAVRAAVTVRGRGKNTVTIVTDGTAFEVEDGGELTLAGLTLRMGEDGAGDLVACTGGRARIERCSIEGAKVRENSGGAGVRAGGDAVAEVDRCELSAHAYVAVCGWGSATIDVTSCTITSSGYGLGALQQSTVRARGCTCTGGSNVAFANSGGTLELTGCELTGGDHGVGVETGSRVTVDGGVIAGASVSNVLVKGRAELRGVRLGPGAGHGLLMLGGELEAAELEVAEHAQCGLVLRGFGAATLEGCDVHDNAQLGIHVDGEVQAQVTGGRVAASHQLVQAAEHAVVHLTDVSLTRATDVGVVARNEATLELGGGTVMECANGGVAARDACSLTVRDATVADHGGFGLGAWERATMLVHGCAIERNAGAALTFLGDSRGEATGNRGAGNGQVMVTAGDFEPLPGARPIGSGAPAPRPIAALLERLDRFLSAARPGVEPRPGAAAGAIAAAEKRLNISFPQSLRALFAWHDGQDGDDTFHHLHRLCSLSEAVETVEMLDSLLAAGDFAPHEDWWHHDWIPIATDGVGNLVVVDLGGAFGGYPGQVIEHWHDDSDRHVLAPDLFAYLSVLVEAYEAGLYVDEDGSFEATDEDAVTELAERLNPGYPVETRARYRQDLILADNELS